LIEEDGIGPDAFLARFQDAFRAGCSSLGWDWSDDVAEACGRYCLRVREGNARMNLTRILEPEDMAVKHVLDSLAVARTVPGWVDGGRVADVGTGAGFPGIPLGIALPAIDLTLVDALRKRLDFVKEASPVPCAIVHARAEDAGRDRALREQFDGVVARALAPLPILLEWCAPLVRPGGVLVAMLGPQSQGEGAPRPLGLDLQAEDRLVLPDAEGSARVLRVYRKVSATPARYPRRPAEIKERPLGE